MPWTPFLGARASGPSPAGLTDTEHCAAAQSSGPDVFGRGRVRGPRSQELRRRSAGALPLIGVLTLALLLRLSGIAWQLPWAFHPDEGHYVWKAVDMLQDGNLNPKYFRNPSLFTYLLLVEYKLLDLLGLGDGLAALSDLLRPPSLYLWLGRLTSALLGVATVGMVYLLGKELLGRVVAVLGALLLAGCFLHVRDSHFATNDVPATFLLLVSVLFSARLARTGRTSDTLLAGVFGGLATSAKYNAGFFVLPLLAAYVWVHRRRVAAPKPLGVLAAAGLLAAAAYLAGTPFTLLAWPTFRDDFLVQQRFSREGWEGQGATPVPWLYLAALGNGMGWVALGLAMLGLVLLARRRPLAALLLGAYPLGYLLFMFGVRLFFVRFAVTVVPFLCLAAAFAVWEVAQRVQGGGRRTAVLALLSAATVAQPLLSDLQHRQIMERPDTRAQAYTWLEANVPSGARIAAEEYSVRDRRPRADLPDRARYDLDQFNALSERDLAAWRRDGYQYAIISSFQYQRFPRRFGTYDALERDTLRLATFAPTADGSELPFDVEALYSPFHDLARYERPGPTVKVYALSPR